MCKWCSYGCVNGVTLAARLLGVDEGAQSPVPRDGTLFGQRFESLMTPSVRTFAQVAEARVRDLREHDGRHEVERVGHGRAALTAAASHLFRRGCPPQHLRTRRVRPSPSRRR